VHARGTAYGVVRQKMTEYAWTHWARPKWGTAKETETRKTLRRGDIGQAVTALQLALLEAGYSLRVYGADGDFGKETEAAVKAFQKANGLAVDGIVGAKTWAALDGAPAAPLYTVTIKDLTKETAEEIIDKYGGTLHANNKGE
jgi:peptidoglycan hydrolase-like protein with peptidoglycan-binding domain